MLKFPFGQKHMLRIEGLDEENNGQNTQKTEREMPRVFESECDRASVTEWMNCSD